jgi:hypothetical protein
MATSEGVAAKRSQIESKMGDKDLQAVELRFGPAGNATTRNAGLAKEIEISEAPYEQLDDVLLPVPTSFNSELYRFATKLVAAVLVDFGYGEFISDSGIGLYLHRKGEWNTTPAYCDITEIIKLSPLLAHSVYVELGTTSYGVVVIFGHLKIFVPLRPYSVNSAYLATLDPIDGTEVFSELSPPMNSSSPQQRPAPPRASGLASSSSAAWSRSKPCPSTSNGLCSPPSTASSPPPKPSSPASNGTQMRPDNVRPCSISVRFQRASCRSAAQSLDGRRSGGYSATDAQGLCFQQVPQEELQGSSTDLPDPFFH